DPGLDRKLRRGDEALASDPLPRGAGGLDLEDEGGALADFVVEFDAVLLANHVPSGRDCEGFRKAAKVATRSGANARRLCCGPAHARLENSGLRKASLQISNESQVQPLSM